MIQTFIIGDGTAKKYISSGTWKFERCHKKEVLLEIIMVSVLEKSIMNGF
jgi:hypothetical protein